MKQADGRRKQKHTANTATEGKSLSAGGGGTDEDRRQKQKLDRDWRRIQQLIEKKGSSAAAGRAAAAGSRAEQGDGDEEDAPALKRARR